MGVDNLVGLRYYGRFYTVFIFQGHQKGVAKGIVVLFIPKNMEEDIDLVWSITETQGVFLCTGKQEEGLIRF